MVTLVADGLHLKPNTLFGLELNLRRVYPEYFSRPTKGKKKSQKINKSKEENSSPRGDL